MQITAIVTGALAVVLGGDVFWSLIGLLVGQLIGGTVMALHGAQGPQLGLPQMISSRVQFGVYGAGIPIEGELTIGKKWSYKGQMHSYISARCETGRLQARGQFKFKDGTFLSGTFIRPCQVRE